MVDHSLTVIPVMERESGKFLGTVISDEVLWSWCSGWMKFRIRFGGVMGRRTEDLQR